MANNIIDKKFLSYDETLHELRFIFDNYDVNRPRFQYFQIEDKAYIFVDADAYLMNGELDYSKGLEIRYEVKSIKVAEKIYHDILDSEPNVGDKVSMKNIWFGPQPEISLKGVEAIITERDIARPTTKGLKLMIKRAENTEGFNSGWLASLRADLNLFELGFRRTALLGRSYCLDIISRPEYTIGQAANILLGKIPSNQNEKNSHRFIEQVVCNAVDHAIG